MSAKLVIGNFKAELSYDEMRTWLADFVAQYPKEGFTDKKVILMPSVVHLQMTKDAITSAQLPVELGVQNISHLEKGAFTGEVTAGSVTSLVSYVLIGHSERRRLFQDRVDRIQEKIYLANSYNLNVILCVDEPERYRGVFFAVAYEPLSAIGTGKPQPAQESAVVLQAIKPLLRADHYIYGGSVNKETAAGYFSAGFTGVLVGKKTLDVSHFIELIKSA